MHSKGWWPEKRGDDADVPWAKMLLKYSIVLEKICHTAWISKQIFFPAPVDIHVNGTTASLIQQEKNWQPIASSTEFNSQKYQFPRVKH